MMNKRFLILTFSIPVFLTSCVVSKKKYEELDYAKRRSDAKVRVLTKENNSKDTKISNLNGKLDKTLAEFNEVKNSMAESNAMKTSEIDAMSTELMGLSSDTTQLKNKLTSTLELYQKAKNQNEQYSLRISALEQKLSNLQSDSLKLSKELNAAQVELSWSRKKVKNEQTRSADLLQQKENQILALQKELEENKGKASWLRKVNAKNKEEIERLGNQLKLYKNELDKAQRKTSKK